MKSILALSLTFVLSITSLATITASNQEAQNQDIGYTLERMNIEVSTSMSHTEILEMIQLIKGNGIELSHAEFLEIFAILELSREESLEIIDLLRVNGIKMPFPEIDYSVGPRNIDTISLDTGRLESFDDEGVRAVAYLTPVELENKLGVMGRSFDTGNLIINVPANFNGHQGIIVGGSHRVVSPHRYVNLQVPAGSLPMNMQHINVAISNELGDDSGWIPNVRNNTTVSMRARFPNERYAVRVSTDANPAPAILRAFTRN